MGCFAAQIGGRNCRMAGGTAYFVRHISYGVFPGSGRSLAPLGAGYPNFPRSWAGADVGPLLSLANVDLLALRLDEVALACIH